MSELDRELARRLAELRRTDEAGAPSFRQVLERPRARRAASVTWSPLRLALAASALVFIALVALLVHRPPDGLSVAQGVRSLAEWKAPTDSLLRTPGSELFDSVPQFSLAPVTVSGESAHPGQRKKGVSP